MKRQALFFFIFISLFLKSPFVFSDQILRNIRIDVFVERVGYETAHGQVSSFSEKTQQFITTLEGYEGTIFVGKRISYVVPIQR